MNRISSRTVATTVLIVLTGCIEPSIGLVLWSDRAAPQAASRPLVPDPAAIAEHVQRLAADHPDEVKLDTLATTAAGRAIHVVRIAARGGA
ncbi:MAG: hypothetical protein HUU22_15170, partial [Phycisphaerae bacterium]|nr:hypothetical protein [Phycisphaerae bacterium]